MKQMPKNVSVSNAEVLKELTKLNLTRKDCWTILIKIKKVEDEFKDDS